MSKNNLRGITFGILESGPNGGLTLSLHTLLFQTVCLDKWRGVFEFSEKKIDRPRCFSVLFCKCNSTQDTFLTRISFFSFNTDLHKSEISLETFFFLKQIPLFVELLVLEDEETSDTLERAGG